MWSEQNDLKLPDLKVREYWMDGYFYLKEESEGGGKQPQCAC